MKGIFGSGRYANVTATLALIIALSGTAYAANTIRSSDIVNGQVKSVDIGTGQVKNRDIFASAVTSGKIRNGTLREKDFKAGEIPAGPQGPRGFTGLPGAAGAPGATGPRGPSDAFSVQTAGDVLSFPAPSTNLIVASVALPAGKYVLNAKVIMNNNDAAIRQYGCSLNLGTTVVDNLFDTVNLDVGASGPEDDRSVAALTGAGTLAAAGTATIVCNTNAVSGNYLARSITAIQVATLNGA